MTGSREIRKVRACWRGGDGARTADVLWGGFVADEHNALAAELPRLRVRGAEHDAADGGARRGGEAGADDVRSVRLGILELRVQQLVEVAGLHHEHRLLLRHEALLLHGMVLVSPAGAVVARTQSVGNERHVAQPLVCCSWLVFSAEIGRIE